MCESSARMNAKQRERADPTKTTMIRRKFEQALSARFRFLRGRIRALVDGDDAFGHRQNAVRQFDFPRSDEKISGFMDWLKGEQADIFQVYEGRPIASAASQHWANVYVDSAYNSGVNYAASQMKKDGVTIGERWLTSAFSRPIHADRIGIIHTRTYTGLSKILSDMDGDISRVLAEGIAGGFNPRVIASALNKRVEKYDGDAARLARTEVINAHAQATLNSYEEAGVHGVDVEAEWLTATDACALCRDLKNGGPYNISEARNLIPAHPNCRCAWAPRVVNGTGIVLN